MNTELKKSLLTYCLRLADTSHILGQRLAEWCGHGPVLEEDIAMTNISLDHIGQARAFYTYAGELEANGKSEDDYAYLRDARDYYNLLIAEQPNGDFGKTMLRQFFISTFQYYLYTELCHSSNKTIAALAEKSLKEVTYHVRHSQDWIIRLGDGTSESKQRLMDALDDLWLYTEDMFDIDEVDNQLLKAGIGADIKKIKSLWDSKVAEVLSLATLDIPQNSFMIKGSREGKHSEHLGYILAEMQVLQRMYPGVTW